MHHTNDWDSLKTPALLIKAPNHTSSNQLVKGCMIEIQPFGRAGAWILEPTFRALDPTFPFQNNSLLPSI